MRFANLVCDRDDFNFVKGDVYNDRMKTLITHKSILYNVFQSPRLNYLYTLFYLFCFFGGRFMHLLEGLQKINTKS